MREMFSRRRISVSFSSTQSLSPIQEEPEEPKDYERAFESDDELESDNSEVPVRVAPTSSTHTTPENPENDSFFHALQSRLLEEEARKRRSGFRTSWIRRSSTARSFSRTSFHLSTPGVNIICTSSSSKGSDSDFFFSPGSEGKSTPTALSIQQLERNLKRRREESLADIPSSKRIRSDSSRYSNFSDEKNTPLRALKRSRSGRHEDLFSPKKKARLIHRSYSASQPASLRRAQSLRTEVSSSSPSTSSSSSSSTYMRIITATGTFRIPRLGQSPTNADWIPTAPSSPEPAPTRRKNNHLHLPPEFFLPMKPALPKDPVPIIAPPSNHVAVPALSSDARAKRRLQLYVLRERQCHQSWELGCQKEISTLDDWEKAIGIGQNFRREVLEWILEVTLRHREGEDLHDQLTTVSTSRETRFHAAYLFLLFFFRSSGTEGKEWDGFEDMVWDMAVGAIAVSVKYHRDFLPPLLPVYASSFQALAPHEMGFEELEDAQTDLLSALDYVLGGTPVGVLDDLWEALPSLRDLFHSDLDDDKEWDFVLRETWRSLMICILGPFFPIPAPPMALLTFPSM
ncbi:uncharacterized protein EV420DRAFT_1170711 [Desarmillaria tabescens]|uniref:Uncharacterized protein n=1 Tax=Armillaria tabescens TaxID=1929756 RepID=A0AA39JCK4_ARMTA|nr:uncharacterized protein EV420DRAFT_1170711 [Desarmillaria tabescens]KAK0439500.1 hypothetical protein EV420DRAFT_1170711 [Desarmillaria tabescens]